MPANASRHDIAASIDLLDNTDVEWDGRLVGLVPRGAGAAARELVAAGDASIPALVDALDDESKFVAAHVLLRLLSGVEYPTSPWNGLDVELAADGRSRVDPGQRQALSARWRRWLGTSPRPRALPIE